MNSSTLWSTALLVCLMLWTLYRFFDHTGKGPATFNGKCFGMLPWGIVIVTVAVIMVLSWKEVKI